MSEILGYFRSDGQDFLEHDLMEFTYSSNHESTLHIFGGSEVVDWVDIGVASTADGGGCRRIGG